MKKIKTLILTCTLPLVFAACSKDNDTNSNPIDNLKQAAKETELQGKTFQGECSLRPLDAIATGIATAGETAIKSAREQFLFEGANLSHSTLVYTSTDCSGPEALVYQENGSFEIHDDQKTADDAKAMDIKYETLTVKTVSNDGVTVANAVKLCGVEEWSTNMEQNVTAKSEDTNCYRVKVPNQDANVYKLENGNLFFGIKARFERSTVRPTSLDRNEKFISN